MDIADTFLSEYLRKKYHLTDEEGFSIVTASNEQTSLIALALFLRAQRYSVPFCLHAIRAAARFALRLQTLTYDLNDGTIRVPDLDDQISVSLARIAAIVVSEKLSFTRSAFYIYTESFKENQGNLPQLHLAPATSNLNARVEEIRKINDELLTWITWNEHRPLVSTISQGVCNIIQGCFPESVWALAETDSIPKRPEANASNSIDLIGDNIGAQVRIAERAAAYQEANHLEELKSTWLFPNDLALEQTQLMRWTDDENTILRVRRRLLQQLDEYRGCENCLDDDRLD